MAILSKQVLSDTQEDWNVLSDPIKAAGWYGRTNGLHTLSFTLRNFVGRIYLMATLENTPEEADANNSWFPVCIGGGDTAWVEFPMTGDEDRGALPSSMYGFQTTGTFCETFIGNVTYIKVGMDRDYLSTQDPHTNSQIDAVGRLEQVLINF